jgi:hypothetical protein
MNMRVPGTVRERTMDKYKEKAKMILDHEEWFADSLAIKVVERPALSVWMILIPIVFIYYFYRFKKFSEGRKEFVKIIDSRKQALSKALERINGDKSAGVAEIADTIGLNGDTKMYYTELLVALFDHYVRLLQASGGSYQELVKSAYGSSGEFTIFLNNLTRIEDRLNGSFRSPEDEKENFSAVVGSIREYSEHIRRATIEKIFAAAS